MINIILISHGKMAKGTLDAASLIIGKQKGIKALTLTKEDSVELLATRLEETLLNLSSNSQGILIIADLFAASPFNVAAKATKLHKNVEVISGLSLPMLTEVMIHREYLNLKELSSLAEKAGIDGVKILSNVVT